MIVINAGFEILTPLDGDYILKHIERCGRVCYKSEERITEESAVKFIKNIISRGHESVLEHFSFTVKFICDRAISHEIVRHRIASFSQESTRYCNYSNKDNCVFIRPCFFIGKEDSISYKEWESSCLASEKAYMTMLKNGAKPEEARSVLPNSLKTELMMTANIREWRHFFKMRTDKAAHPQIREVAIPLLAELKKQIPVVFDDIN